MPDYSFCIIRPTEADWQLIETSSDSTCFHTHKWNNYVHRCGYKSVVIRILRKEQCIGYFIGTKLWLGVRLLCAPLDSLGYTQGLVTMQPITNEERVMIYKQLADWLFKKHIAHYLSVDDWQLREDRTEWIPENTWRSPVLDAARVSYTARSPLYLPMNKSIDELWAGLHYKSAKYSINKARKLGLYVREITRKEDISEFVRIHYEQLCEVSARHRLQYACEELFPSRVLMLQVLGNDENGVEQVMSSAVFFPDKGQTSYSTGASYTRYQKYCPNELMVWEAIRILRERGAGDINFGGMASYKLKFGTQYAFIPRIIFSRYRWLATAKASIKVVYHKFRRIMGKF